MRVAVIMIFLAFAIGVVPLFSHCWSDTMKCHHTANAELILAVPLIVAGGFLGASKRGWTRLFLSAFGTVLGIVVILLPAALIGVCASPSMICNSFMRPFLILAGTLTAAMNTFVMARWLWRKKEDSWVYSG